MERVVLTGVRPLLDIDRRAILKVDLGRPAFAVGVLADAVPGAPGVDKWRYLGRGIVYVAAERVVLMFCVQ